MAVTPGTRVPSRHPWRGRTNMMKRNWLAPAVLLSFSACSTSAPTGSVGQASNGNRPAWAVPANLVGRVAADERITIQVQLALHNQAAAEAELAEISDPDSARYGQFLTDEEFSAKYAPKAEE